ncbi:MAG: pitrilysin family protein [Pseudomonadota bacterium]
MFRTKPPRFAGLMAAQFVALVSLIAVAVAPAGAVDIKEIKGKSGVGAYLVEDYTVPLIAISISFRGGSTQDAAGKEGTASLLTTLLDEGAGELDSQTFQAKLDEHGIEMGFSAGYDRFTGRLKTLRSTRKEAFELLALALQKPRFDAEPVERMKASLFARLQRAETNPESLAGKAFRESVFAGHPYARPSKGTVATMPKLAPEDVRALHKRMITRENVTIGIVGAISAEEAQEMIDQVFGGLPEKAKLVDVPEAKPIIGETKQIEQNVPQSVIRLAVSGMKRSDPEFYAAYVMNHILGGGSFSSRLYTEVREKRGLAYGAYSFMATYDYAGVLGAGSATRADRASKTIEIMQAEFKRMAEEGPTPEEFERAKKYIIGSYAISNLDSSSKIAEVLVAIQTENLGIDYIDKRRDYIGSVTIEQTKQAAKKLLMQKPTIVVVGRTGS